MEANVYDVNTLASICNCSQYNRGIRAQKHLYEALRSIQFTEFIDYMNSSENQTFIDQLQQFDMCLEEIRDVTEDKDLDDLSTVLLILRVVSLWNALPSDFFPEDSKLQTYTE